jgi:hypothetical protein
VRDNDDNHSDDGHDGGHDNDNEHGDGVDADISGGNGHHTGHITLSPPMDLALDLIAISDAEEADLIKAHRERKRSNSMGVAMVSSSSSFASLHHNNASAAPIIGRPRVRYHSSYHVIIRCSMLDIMRPCTHVGCESTWTPY